jgi:four helix bundle protein
MAKALQNADETDYWLKLIHYAELLNKKEYESIEADRKELAKMLNSIVKTTKEE